MEFIIALIILIIGLVVYGMFSRKKIYQEIDRLETIKVELANTPLADDLTHIPAHSFRGTRQAVH